MKSVLEFTRQSRIWWLRFVFPLCAALSEEPNGHTAGHIVSPAAESAKTNLYSFWQRSPTINNTFKGWSISMLSVLCGVLPLPPPLVWQCPSSAVTGETGCSLASPQKSGELNKPPGKHKISFTLCSWATPKEVLLPPSKKEQEVVSQSRSGSLPAPWLDYFFIPSPSLLSSHSAASFLVLLRPMQASRFYRSSLSCNGSVFFISAVCLF